MIQLANVGGGMSTTLVEHNVHFRPVETSLPLAIIIILLFNCSANGSFEPCRQAQSLLQPTFPLPLDCTLWHPRLVHLSYFATIQNSLTICVQEQAAEQTLPWFSGPLALHTLSHSQLSRHATRQYYACGQKVWHLPWALETAYGSTVFYEIAIWQSFQCRGVITVSYPHYFDQYRERQDLVVENLIPK